MVSCKFDFRLLLGMVWWTEQACVSSVRQLGLELSLIFCVT